MSEVIVFLASCVADLWDLFYDNLPRAFFTYLILLFTIGLIVSRIILPVIAHNDIRFFGKNKGGD